MAIHRIDYDHISQLSSRDKAYQSEDNPFIDFINYIPSLDTFNEVINHRKAKPVNREKLVEVLTNQYSAIDNKGKVTQNINLLSSENTFTIITAHQPSLFTGPLYYVYKILSVVNLAEKLTKQYPQYNFVPVFISGGEDHDFEEINKTHIFNKTIVWDQKRGGSVGRLPLDGLENSISELKEILSDRDQGNKIKAWIDDAYAKSQTYADFTLRLVHHIFGRYGLVTLNPDNKELKTLFVPTMKRELLYQESQPLVEATQADIDKLGFKSQAHAREINLFYLQEGSRSRIVLDDNVYSILDTDLKFSEEEIIDELENHPERFSPNVIMRPLYQETILPNLAYIGGGGELAYWIERKSQFEAFNSFYPMLIRRASLMLLTKSHVKNMAKLNISVEELFNAEHQLISKLLDQESEVNLNLDKEVQEMSNLFKSIAEKAKVLDPTLEKKILAEGTKQSKVIEQLESRLKRTVKSQQETEVNKIKSLKSKLFPSNGLQERHDNFLQYYDMFGQDLLDLLKESINPLDKSFIVIEL